MIRAQRLQQKVDSKTKAWLGGMVSLQRLKHRSQRPFVDEVELPSHSGKPMTSQPF
jgi:hypothetical protein